MLLAASTVDGLNAESLRTDDVIINIIGGDVPVVGVAVGDFGHRGLLLFFVVIPRQRQGLNHAVDLRIELIRELLGQDKVALGVGARNLKFNSTPAIAVKIIIPASLREVHFGRSRCGSHLDELCHLGVFEAVEVTDSFLAGIEQEWRTLGQGLGGSIVGELDVGICKDIDILVLLVPVVPLL